MNDFHYSETNQILNRQIEFIGKKIILTVDFKDQTFLLEDISFELFVENSIVQRVSSVRFVFSHVESSLLLIGAVGKSLNEIICHDAPLHVVILKDVCIDTMNVGNIEETSMTCISYQPVCLLAE